MKVIFLGDSIGTQNTGIHYYGVQLVQLITKEHPEHQYSIVLPAIDPQFDFRQIIVPVRNGKQWHLRFRQLWTIPQIIKQEDPDMVIELAHFGPFRLPKRIKRITVIHDLTPVLYPQYHDTLSVWMHRLLIPRIIHKAHHLVVNSHQTKRDLIKLYQIPEEGMTVVYPQIIRPATEIDNNRIDLPKPYFLTVGTIEPRKNHLTILRAFEIFCKTNTSYKLVIAGKKGWFNETFFEAYHQSKVKDRIILTGYIDRSALWKYYQEAYAFIFASHYEGFGLPVLEAMSFGLPLIVADNSSLREIIGKGGWTFMACDHDELAQLVIKVTESENAERLKLKSHDRFAKLQLEKSDFDFI